MQASKTMNLRETQELRSWTLGYACAMMAILQCVWPWVVISNLDAAKELASISLVGIVYMFIFLSPLIVIPLLVYVGVQLMRTVAYQGVCFLTPRGEGQWRNALVILALLALLEALFGALLYAVADATLVLSVGGAVWVLAMKGFTVVFYNFEEHWNNRT